MDTKFVKRDAWSEQRRDHKDFRKKKNGEAGVAMIEHWEGAGFMNPKQQDLGLSGIMTVL